MYFNKLYIKIKSKKWELHVEVIIVEYWNTSTGWTINISMTMCNFFRQFLIIMASYVSFIDIESCRKWSINDVINFWIFMGSGRYSEIFKIIVIVIMSRPAPIQRPKVEIICLPLMRDSMVGSNVSTTPLQQWGFL